MAAGIDENSYIQTEKNSDLEKVEEIVASPPTEYVPAENVSITWKTWWVIFVSQYVVGIDFHLTCSDSFVNIRPFILASAYYCSHANEISSETWISHFICVVCSGKYFCTNIEDFTLLMSHALGIHHWKRLGLLMGRRKLRHFRPPPVSAFRERSMLRSVHHSGNFA